MFVATKVRPELEELQVMVLKPRRFAEDGTPLEQVRVSIEGERLHVIVTVDEWRGLVTTVEAALKAASPVTS